MAYASLSGRARTNPSSPDAHGICDRCGGRWNLKDLQWQFDWRGKALSNLRILVCRPCLDLPQQQLMAFAVPADPVPVLNPRTQNFDDAEGDYRVTSPDIVVDFWTSIDGPGGAPQRATQSPGIRVSQAIGATGGTEIPPGLDVNASMALYGKKIYNVLLPVSTITADGSSTLTVTCSSAHGLTTNDQITVRSSALSSTDGFYSVVVVDTLTFTFDVNANITNGTNLLLPSTQLRTTLVGIPRGMVTIPQIGP